VDVDGARDNALAHERTTECTRRALAERAGRVSALRLPALCQSCGERGVMTGESGKVPWCKCTGKKPGGPYVAPPGFVARFTFEARDAAAFRERCCLAGNAEREARDRLSERWVRCGRGWRELPRSSSKRKALEASYRAALRALEALQTECSHPERSLFAKEYCGVCHARVEVEIAQFRHLEREIGARAARRFAA
jgi:hypothetical protein